MENKYFHNNAKASSCAFIALIRQSYSFPNYGITKVWLGQSRVSMVRSGIRESLVNCCKYLNRLKFRPRNTSIIWSIVTLLLRLDHIFPYSSLCSIPTQRVAYLLMQCACRRHPSNYMHVQCMFDVNTCKYLVIHYMYNILSRMTVFIIVKWLLNH